MILAGPVTALPLLLFAAAAQRLPMVTLGLLFYLTPAMQMAWGVVVGHEPMPAARWLGFALIWVALAGVQRSTRSIGAPRIDPDVGSLRFESSCTVTKARHHRHQKG